MGLAHHSRPIQRLCEAGIRDRYSACVRLGSGIDLTLYLYTRLQMHFTTPPFPPDSQAQLEAFDLTTNGTNHAAYIPLVARVRKCA